MYIKKNDYDKALKKVKIEFGTLIGLDTDAEAFVILKEMDTLSTLKMRALADKEDEVIVYFKELLPNILVDHNLYETEDKKMSPKDVANFIFEKLEVSSKIIGDYTSSVFRIKPNTEDGDKVSK